MMRGFHFTPTRNLPAIQRDGLMPYALRADITDVAGATVQLDELGLTRGIFVWLRWQTGLSHYGTATACGMRHGAATVAVLELQFDATDAATTDLPLAHDGTLDGCAYHVAEPFVIVTATIPPERVRLIETVPTAAALGYVLGASGALAEWQADRIARGLPAGLGATV